MVKDKKMCLHEKHLYKKIYEIVEQDDDVCNITKAIGSDVINKFKNGF